MDGLPQLKRTNLYEQAIDSLLNYIIVNDLKEGDRLPAEQQLKESFGISRSTLREAIKSLQMIGLIESKQKSGIVIKNFSISDLTKFIPYVTNVKDKELRKLIEAREWLEYSLLPLIVKNRTEANLEKLQGIIHAIDESIAQNQEINELDYEFHKALVECSSNPFIESMNSVLREFFNLHMHEKKKSNLTESIQSDYTTNEEHKIIYNCIAERNLPRLQRIFKKALSTYNINYPNE